MVSSPCLNCKNRTIPKDCEGTCELWKNFKVEKEKERKLILESKQLKYRIEQSIYAEKKRRKGTGI